MPAASIGRCRGQYPGMDNDLLSEWHAVAGRNRHCRAVRLLQRAGGAGQAPGVCHRLHPRRAVGRVCGKGAAGLSGRPPDPRRNMPTGRPAPDHPSFAGRSASECSSSVQLLLHWRQSGRRAAAPARNDRAGKLTVPATIRRHQTRKAVRSPGPPDLSSLTR